MAENNTSAEGKNVGEKEKPQGKKNPDGNRRDTHTRKLSIAKELMKQRQVQGAPFFIDCQYHFQVTRQEFKKSAARSPAIVIPTQE